MIKRIIALTYAICILSVFAAHAQPYIISTVAGSGNSGYFGDGGPATLAGLNQPWGVAVDDTGNLFIGDQENGKVRKVNLNGIISTVAGCDTCYYLNDGKPATQANISVPLGVAVDTAGLYIADFGSRRIRKVDPKGIIHTLAGTGKGGYSGDGGPADSATMSEPYGICVDKYGNVYFADAFNNVIRKINKHDTITTFAGNGIQANGGAGGLAIDAEVREPLGVASDTAGNIYIGSFWYVWKVDTNGIITIVAGNGTVGHSGDGGPATDAQIDASFDIAVDDSGNIFIGEAFGNYIRKVSPDGIIKTIAGIGVNAYSNYTGDPDTAKFSWPMGVITDPFGNIFIGDSNNQLIRELSPCTSPVTLTPSSVKICRGVTVALNAKGHNTYSWSPGSSLKDSIGYSVLATPSVTTTYVVSGTTCYAHDTIVVTVDTTTKIPALKVSPTSTTLCNGQSVTLKATGATAYSWSPVWGLNNSSGANVIATPTITTTFVVTEPTCMATDTAVVNVNPVPSIYVYPATTTFFCAGQTITLYEGGANDFIWSPMTGLDTTNADSVNANPTITTTYSVYGTSLGCNSQPQTIVLSVQPIPVVSITPSLPGLCTGSFATIIGNGAASYLWGPSAGLSDTSGDTIIATPTITTTYTVTGTTSGCVSPTDTFVVAVDTMPVISIDPPSAGFCQGANTTFIASGAPSYTWSPATGLSATTGDTVVANPSVNTTYTVTGINIGCASIPDTITVTVAQAPNKPTITISPTGDSLISSAGSYNQWYFNSKALADSTRKVLVIKGHQKGWYEVTVTNPANGCGATSDSTTSIDQVSINNNRLSIYPNPASGTVIITSAINIEQVKITNVLGQLLFQSTPNYLGDKQTINVSTLPDGIYFITVFTTDKTTAQKLVVSK